MKDVLLCVGAVMRTKIAEQTAYRSHFFLSLFLMIAGDLLVPMLTLLVYSSGVSFPGWSLHEALLIQGIFGLAKGIAFPLFFGMIGSTLSLVREGTFDLLLLKPRPTLFMTILHGLDPEDFGRLFSGGILFGYALSGLESPTVGGWLQFAGLFMASLAVLCAFSLFMSGILFKWVGGSRVYDMFDSITSFGLYPGTIYAKSFQQLTTYVIPVALIAFIPAKALLGRAGWETLWAAIVGILFLAVGIAFWQRMLRSYTSAGG
ncbi:ABC-2 family transporter protein [Paenibacillus sp. GSMTC-2017]|uniref:ABC transporter permease n=1 Tax=Paenibacillus sp. GSMTC-2017 TaxID=2794350 RepID=UPI0018D9DB3D|nr:ABC-2 family transporter protein [Paenibacillus sp. GSMTC-2017]MBH5319877.1 ABC-2 family transporter protein [Paenibacillus sp. GSMTC-2017]